MAEPEKHSEDPEAAAETDAPRGEGDAEGGGDHGQGRGKPRSRQGGAVAKTLIVNVKQSWGAESGDVPPPKPPLERPPSKPGVAKTAIVDVHKAWEAAGGGQERAKPLSEAAMRAADDARRERAERKAALDRNIATSALRKVESELGPKDASASPGQTGADEDAVSDEQTVAALVQLLDPKNGKAVVIGAAQSLAGLKARSALPHIVKLLGAEDAEIKAAAQKAIDRLTQ